MVNRGGVRRGLAETAIGSLKQTSEQVTPLQRAVQIGAREVAPRALAAFGEVRDEVSTSAALERIQRLGILRRSDTTYFHSDAKAGFDRALNIAVESVALESFKSGFTLGALYEAAHPGTSEVVEQQMAEMKRLSEQEGEA